MPLGDSVMCHYIQQDPCPLIANSHVLENLNRFRTSNHCWNLARLSTALFPHPWRLSWQRKYEIMGADLDSRKEIFGALNDLGAQTSLRETPCKKRQACSGHGNTCRAIYLASNLAWRPGLLAAGSATRQLPQTIRMAGPLPALWDRVKPQNR